MCKNNWFFWNDKIITAIYYSLPHFLVILFFLCLPFGSVCGNMLQYKTNLTIHHTGVLFSFLTAETNVTGGGSSAVASSMLWWYIELPLAYWPGIIFTLLYNALDIEGMHTYWPMWEAPAGWRQCHCCRPMGQCHPSLGCTLSGGCDTSYILS